jgi:hypothetical protein
VSVSENVALVRRYYASVWEQGDFAVDDELISPDEVYLRALCDGDDSFSCCFKPSAQEM